MLVSDAAAPVKRVNIEVDGPEAPLCRRSIRQQLVTSLFSRSSRTRKQAMVRPFVSSVAIRPLVLAFLALMAAASTPLGGQSSALVPAGARGATLTMGPTRARRGAPGGFNDAAWATGRAQLGYGDGDEATVVGYGANSSAKHVTTYFRRTFSVANPAAFGSLNLRMLRDDGAVVYLNGSEVFRTNMPTGAISHTTPASAAIAGADESAFVSVASVRRCSSRAPM